MIFAGIPYHLSPSGCTDGPQPQPCVPRFTRTAYDIAHTAYRFTTTNRAHSVPGLETPHGGKMAEFGMYDALGSFKPTRKNQKAMYEALESACPPTLRRLICYIFKMHEDRGLTRHSSPLRGSQCCSLPSACLLVQGAIQKVRRV